MMDTEQWCDAKDSPIDPVKEGFKAGTFASENLKIPKFVTHQDANPKQLTFDGCSMEAAIKVGGNGWLVFVKEDEGYRLRSGAECGGPNYTKDIVENLPRVGKGDDELLTRELNALKNDEKSSFVESTGIVQHPSGTWILTKWQPDANGDIESRWVSRTTLVKCLKSRPMVEALIENHGGTLLPRGTLKLQWTTAAAMKARQKLLCDVQDPLVENKGNSSSDQTTLIKALELLNVNRFKHPVYSLVR